MSWLYSRALVAEFLEACCLDGEPCAQLNLTPTPHPFWRNDKTMEFSGPSQFGLTCAVLTADRGEELLTWYRAGFHARTSAQPAKAKALTANAVDYGESSLEFLGRFDHDTHSLRTAQYSLFADSTESLQTLPPWGLMRDGELFQQPTPARLTSAKESGLWLTPTAQDAKNNGGPAQMERNTLPLNAEVKRWPTPTALTNTGGAAMCRWGGSGARAKLHTMTTPEEINGALHPEWVEWLMGWPVGWTSLNLLDDAQVLPWDTDPADSGDIPRVATGIDYRVDRLKAIGNGQVPVAARLAWELLSDASITTP